MIHQLFYRDCSLKVISVQNKIIFYSFLFFEYFCTSTPTNHDTVHITMWIQWITSLAQNPWRVECDALSDKRHGNMATIKAIEARSVRISEFLFGEIMVLLTFPSLGPPNPVRSSNHGPMLCREGAC